MRITLYTHLSAYSFSEEFAASESICIYTWEDTTSTGYYLFIFTPMNVSLIISDNILHPTVGKFACKHIRVS